MKNIPNIILVGPMGAGKTTIGRLLSQLLQRDFLDSDRVIEELAGADIPWIFEKEGELGFRRRETAALQQLTDGDEGPLILATGGGAIMREENRAILRQGGLVVYLYATIAQQMHRTSKSNHRPLLQNGNRQKILTDLFNERDPLYRDAANLIVETDSRNPKLVANKVLESIKEELKKQEKKS